MKNLYFKIPENVRYLVGGFGLIIGIEQMFKLLFAVIL